MRSLCRRHFPLFLSFLRDLKICEICVRLSVTAAVAGLGLGLEGGIVGLLEDHILHQRLDDHVLLLDLPVLLRLANDHPLSLRLEQHAARGDILCAAVILLVRADGTESHLEDADAVELHLLAQFEEVLQGTAQLVEYGLDVTLLHRCLCLDELGQFLGLDEMLVVDSRGEPLALGSAVVVLVLEFLEFLTHVG